MDNISNISALIAYRCIKFHHTDSTTSQLYYSAELWYSVDRAANYGTETWSVTVTVLLSKKVDALDIWWFWLSIGQNLSPMTRYALVLGSRSCPTLDTCTAPTPHKTITVLYKPALWVLLMIGDGGLAVPDNPSYEQWRLTCDQWTSSQTILATNSGGWPATNEPRTGDVEVACSGQINMAETHSDGYVYDKLLKKKKKCCQRWWLLGTHTWNDLPADVTSAPSLFTFRKWLKLHLFWRSYPGLVS